MDRTKQKYKKRVELNDMQLARDFSRNQIKLALALKDHGFPQLRQRLTYYYAQDHHVHLIINEDLKEEDWKFFRAFVPLENTCYDFLNNMKLYDRCIYYSNRSKTVATHVVIKKPDSKKIPKTAKAARIAFMLEDSEENPENYWISSANNELTALYLATDQFLRWVKDIRISED